MEISPACARLIQLSTLSLLTPPQNKAAKDDVLAMIRHLGVLQIDTIHVVARSPYLVLWSRLGNYRPIWLEQLLTEGRLFEYWSHAACFIPVEDYPIYRRMMLDNVHGDWRDPTSWLSEHAGIANAVLEKIRAEGPLRSADFESTNKQPGGWWNWKEEKQALEHWLTAGELMVARRQGFQRVYDLRERVLPEWDDNRALPYDQALR
jgi:uncharacterized protein